MRLYLQGGGDKVTVEGDGSSSPVVRVIGGGGDDQYTVTERGGVKLYDDKGSNTAQGAGINTKEWKWKPDSTKPNELPPRDWGARTMRLMQVNVIVHLPSITPIAARTRAANALAFRRQNSQAFA